MIKATLIITATISFVLLAYLAKSYPYFPIDLVVTRAIQSFHPSWFDQLMKAVSNLGEVGPGTITILLVVAFLYIKKKKAAASFIILSTLGAEIIGFIFKSLVSRVRPDPNLINQLGHFIQHDSFPSGHVLFYVSLFGFLIYLTYKNKLLTIIFATLILLSGISRIYLGAHWLSDVLGAYLIGFVWLSLVTFLYRTFTT